MIELNYRLTSTKLNLCGRKSLINYSKFAINCVRKLVRIMDIMLAKHIT